MGPATRLGGLTKDMEKAAVLRNLSLLVSDLMGCPLLLDEDERDAGRILSSQATQGATHTTRNSALRNGSHDISFVDEALGPLVRTATEVHHNIVEYLNEEEESRYHNSQHDWCHCKYLQKEKQNRAHSLLGTLTEDKDESGKPKDSSSLAEYMTCN